VLLGCRTRCLVGLLIHRVKLKYHWSGAAGSRVPEPSSVKRCHLTSPWIVNRRTRRKQITIGFQSWQKINTYVASFRRLRFILSPSCSSGCSLPGHFLASSAPYKPGTSSIFHGPSAFYYSSPSVQGVSAPQRRPRTSVEIRKIAMVALTVLVRPRPSQRDLGSRDLWITT